MRRIVFLMLLALLSLATSVYAQGDTTPTPFMDTQMCVQNTAGFDDQFHPLPNLAGGFLNKVFITASGRWHLNGDGTATSDWHSTATVLENYLSGGGMGSCTGPITRLDDGTLLWSYSCQLQITYGDNVGTTQTITGASSVQYIVDVTGTAVNHNATPPLFTPTIERVDAVPPPPGDPYTFYRVCSRGGVNGVRLP